jgi:putative sigma-54 modulation protein
MNVSITFRHMDASEAIKKHTAAKLGKLQKFLRQPMTAKVTISVDKLKHVAEARISSGGAHLEAKARSADPRNEGCGGVASPDGQGRSRRHGRG